MKLRKDSRGPTLLLSKLLSRFEVAEWSRYNSQDHDGLTRPRSVFRPEFLSHLYQHDPIFSTSRAPPMSWNESSDHRAWNSYIALKTYVESSPMFL